MTGFLYDLINNNFSRCKQHQQAVSDKGFTSFNIFNHSNIKVRRYYKKAWMFTVNKSLRVLATRQLVAALSTQARNPTHPQTFNESFYQCHSIPQKVKVASVERGVLVLERKVPTAPELKARDQNKLPLEGCKLERYVACWFVRWCDEWIHFKKSNYSAEANRPRTGVKRKKIKSTFPCGI